MYFLHSYICIYYIPAKIDFKLFYAILRHLKLFFLNQRQELRETGSNINCKKSIIYCFLTVRLYFLNLNSLKLVFIRFK